MTRINVETINQEKINKMICYLMDVVREFNNDFFPNSKDHASHQMKATGVAINILQILERKDN